MHNDVPLIRRIRLAYDGADHLSNLRICISSAPEFAQPFQLNIPLIRQGDRLEWTALEMQLEPKLLSQVAETEICEVNAVLKDEEDKVLCEHSFRVNLLPFNHWPGARILPEIIAAFVEPNHLIVRQLQMETVEVLQSLGQPPSLSGYQIGGHERVIQNVAALFEAIKRHCIAYAPPPPTYNTEGQKIRTPDEIMKYKLSTCIDQTVLFAACMEAMGLNPLIIFIEGHAFCGVWLTDTYFPDKYRDDPTDITKRLAHEQEDILIFESTLSTAGHEGVTFEDARKAADANITTREVFEYVVDIKGCRMAGIRPLPLREVQGDTVVIKIDNTSPQKNDSENRSLREYPGGEVTSIERTRLDSWMRRLLDISGRNNLVNMHSSRSILRLNIHNLSELEDALSKGVEFRIYPQSDEWSESSLRDRTLYQHRTGDDPLQKALVEDFHMKILRATTDKKELDLSITQIYRSARISVEESGANTLYLALGMLAWCETGNEDNPHLAPIILIPMELKRKSVQEGFVIKQGEEEPIINFTLLEMMRQNFGVDIPLDNLPSDDQGINVQQILSIFRREVMNFPHWDILEDAALGIFSFNKFMLWYDLHVRSQELAKNKIVSSLIANEKKWTDTDGFPSPEELDDRYQPDQLFCPVSADSSQLAAIAAASQGCSFLLQGPPGTGKSQTITNIIANALMQGKRILFVAEKMAALSVVKRRLESVGLGDFCLELHSNKSDKKEVLKQFAQSLNITSSRSPENWEQTANRLCELRTELNQYVRKLHEPQKIGKSVFEAIGRFERVRNSAGGVRFSPAELENVTSDTIRNWTELIHDLCIAGSAGEHPKTHPLHECGLDYCPPALNSQAEDALDSLIDSIKDLISIQAKIAPLLGMSQNPSYDELKIVRDACEHILKALPIPAKDLVVSDWETAKDSLAAWIVKGRERDRMRSDIFSTYKPVVLQLPTEKLRETLESADASWFIPRMLKKRAVMKSLRQASKQKSFAERNLFDEVDKIHQLQVAEHTLESVGDKARELLGRIWADGNPDWDAVETAVSWNTEMRALSARLAGINAVALDKVRNRWMETVDQYREEGGEEGPVGTVISQYLRLKENFDKLQAAASALLVINEKGFNSDTSATDYLQNALGKAERWRANLNQLAKWAAYVRARTKAANNGLSQIVTFYEKSDKHLSERELQDAFERGLYHSWLQYFIPREPTLCNFTREMFEGMIEKFRTLDEQYVDLTKKVIYARLAANIPHGDGQNAAPSSERGVLHRELQKQRRIMPLRTLFQKTPTLFPRLKPCLLMSPLSVAQYLDPSNSQFDLVIFDEASQVPTCEAVGAIARGKEAIIVGDQMQLPPTTFFQTKESEDYEDEDTLQDLESILDDCLAFDMQKKRLDWHYRSRHESLIAFSNHQFYENSLLTFPSPDDLTTRVSFHFVNGVYDRSKSRTNRIEADAIVNEIMRRLHDHELRQYTIGVVTLNKPQQQLIEDLLDEKRRTHPEIEHFFEAASEPLFVKNLENVQGDERDVILFSICYGPDQTGRISMNFGPINQVGGARRLNVAVSRSRHEMQVYASLRHDQIDSARTLNGSLAKLKSFLEYAENGRASLYRNVSANSNAACESYFEEQVKAALEREEMVVHSQVGCSGYRIDLAIVHPEFPGRYVLGIECDGAFYHSAKTARDRDKLRQRILEGLGWTIHRIWSRDWWDNPTEAIMRVKQAYSDAMTRHVDPPLSHSENKMSQYQSAPNAEPPIVRDTTDRNSLTPPRIQTAATSYPALDYRMSGNSDQFYNLSSTRQIAQQILSVVEKEGPISQSLMCKRVASMWGIGRVTDRVVNRILNVCPPLKLRATKEANGVIFIWPQSLPSMQLSKYRVVTNGMDKLDSRDICREEIALAVNELLQEQFSMLEEDLIRETAQRFGYSRIGDNVRESMKRGVECLIGKKLIEMDERGRVSLKNP